MTLTPKQTEAGDLLAQVTNLLLFGAAGSGKTFFALTVQAAIASKTTARCLTTGARPPSVPRPDPAQAGAGRAAR